MAAILFIILGITDCSMRERTRVQYSAYAMSDEEKVRFMPILKKHGLQYDVNVVYNWESGSPYYIDKMGRRIKFK